MTNSVTIRYCTENSVTILKIVDDSIKYRFIFFLDLVTISDFCMLNEDDIYDCMSKKCFLSLEKLAMELGILQCVYPTVCHIKEQA